MAQVAFAFESFTPALPDTEDPAFRIGWDHARHGELPPSEHLHPTHPVRQGWEAGRASLAGRCLKSGPAVRRWLGLRLHAWLAGEGFEPVQVTPHFLAQLCTGRCPVTGEADVDPAPLQITRVNQQAGYAAGNLAALSPRVVAVLSGLGWQQAHVNARLAGSQGTGTIQGLSAAEWSRLAILMSFVTPLPHGLAASLPLSVLPTNRLRLLNPIQGLQAVVTLQLAQPAWSVRIVQLVASIPGSQARREFQLFFHSLLARVFAQGLEDDPARLRERMQAAWCSERVLRRWERFAACLSADQADALLQRASRMGLTGQALQWHGAEQAVDGWGLAATATPCRSAIAGTGTGASASGGATRRRSGVGDPRCPFGRRQVRQVVEAQQGMPLA